MSWKVRRFLAIAFLFTTFIIYAAWLMQADRLNLDDWEQFNSFSYVYKSLILGYHTLPIHNPWSCGGIDFVINPQTRIFSPNVLFDLLFYPPLSNLLPLILTTLFGLWGCFLFLRQIKLSMPASFLGAVLFVNSSWFGLHFAEGHITFGNMQLLSLVAYLTLRLHESVRYFFYLCLLLCFFILDGSIYTLFFSICLSLTIFLTKTADAAGTIKRLFENKISTLLILLAAVLVTLPKTLPVLLHPPNTFFYSNDDYRVTMPFSFFKRAFFDINQNIRTDFQAVHFFHDWEFGTYFSPFSLALVIVAFFLQLSYARKNWCFAVAALFWFWVATGIFAKYNPWVLIKYLPFLDRLHMQSRTLIIVFIFFVVLVTKALDGLDARKPHIARIFACILLWESFYVRIHSSLVDHMPEPLVIGKLIDNTNIDETVQFSRSPTHFLKHNTGSATCYEPSFSPQHIFSNDQKEYRGEAYSMSPKDSWDVKLLSYTPGSIRLQVNHKRPRGFIRLNTNALYGWKVIGGQARLRGSGPENLDVEPLQNSGEIVLKYEPSYLNWCLGSYCSGILLLTYLFLRRKRLFAHTAV